MQGDIPANANMLISPSEPSPGAIGAFAKNRNLDEIRQLESKREVRLWEVRAYISDHVPLADDADASLPRPSYHLLHLNENPLWIYLHSGGRNAIYYGLFGDHSGKLEYIALKVESRLPSNALLLARGPVNALLDVFTRDSHMPLVVQRLELISPVDNRILVSEFLIPQRNGVRLGPLGGIMQAVPFAPYDALYREALTTTSPFYRLLCAWKMYEGTDRIRKWIREQCEQHNISDRLPPDVQIDSQELIGFGFDTTFVQGVRCARDLFSKLGDQRDAIAHFLIERDGAESHVYVADGRQLHAYATGSSALLRYAHRVLEELRLFCAKHMLLSRGSMILPMPRDRDQFVVRATDYGLE
jgi:methylamine utilization protein MauJ